MKEDREKRETDLGGREFQIPNYTLLSVSSCRVRRFKTTTTLLPMIYYIFVLGIQEARSYWARVCPPLIPSESL
jgi:hypothetical protein